METPAYMVGLPKLQAPERVKDHLIQIQTKGPVKSHDLVKHGHQQMLRRIQAGNNLLLPNTSMLQLFSAQELP